MAVIKGQKECLLGAFYLSVAMVHHLILFSESNIWMIAVLYSILLMFEIHIHPRD